MDPEFQKFLHELETLILRYSKPAPSAHAFPPLDGYSSPIIVPFQKRLRFIADLVAAHFGMPLSKIIAAPGKKGPVIHAEIRFMAYRLSREFTKCSQNQIAQFYRRDHGTLLHGLRRFDDLYKTDPEYADAYNFLAHKLKETFEPQPDRGSRGACAASAEALAKNPQSAICNPKSK